MDVDRLLNLEKRTGISDGDISDFLSKATAVEEAVRALRDGTVDPENLKVEGIETEEEKREKEAARKKAQQELKEKRKQEEKERWWAGVELFVTPEETTQENESVNKALEFRKLRYEANYSHWESWTPDDSVSKEEERLAQEAKDNELNEEFERNNPDFCKNFMQDMKKREEESAKKRSSASTLRLRGNRYFKAKNFADALSCYMEALKLLPYDAAILSNIGQAHIKLNEYEDALEFFRRALKARSRIAFIYAEQGKYREGVDILQQAVALEPDNIDIQEQLLDLRTTMQEKEYETANASSTNGLHKVIDDLLAESSVNPIASAALVAGLHSDIRAVTYLRTSGVFLNVVDRVAAAFKEKCCNTDICALFAVVVTAVELERSSKLLITGDFVSLCHDVLLAPTTEPEYLTLYCKLMMTMLDSNCLKSRQLLSSDSRAVPSIIRGLQLKAEAKKLSANELSLVCDAIVAYCRVPAILESITRGTLLDSLFSVWIQLMTQYTTRTYQLHLVETMMHWSQIEALRTRFNLSVNGSTLIHSIVQIAEKTSSLQSVCFALLMNVTIVNENRDVALSAGAATLSLHTMRRSTYSYGDEEKGIIVCRAFGLYSRLIAVQPDLVTADVYSLCCKQLKANNASNVSDRWVDDEKNHLIRIIATVVTPSELHRSVVKEENTLQILIGMLPDPRRELLEITAASVVLPPAHMPSTILLGNIARCLLHYADYADMSGVVFDTGARHCVEKYICCMANCTDMRVRKNFAILLAKGSRYPGIRDKITHFRGMQMMIEMQESLK